MTSLPASLKLNRIEASPVAIRLAFALIIALNLLMAFTIAEQGRTITSQRALIRVLNRYDVQPGFMHERLLRN